MNVENIEIGWRRIKGSVTAHYWRTYTASTIAVSACGEVIKKDKIASYGDHHHCSYCEFRLDTAPITQQITEVS